jgi:hypothetical protein
MGCERRRRCNPSEVWVAQPASPSSWLSRMSGRRPRRSSRCPRPLSAMRTDVRPPGRADVRCPGDQCPGDRCPGDRCPRDWRPYDRGDPGVRTARRPMSAAAAAALSAPCWIPDVGAAGPTTVGEPGSTCRCGRRAAWSPLPDRAWRGRDGRTLVVRGWHEHRRQPWPPLRGPRLTTWPGRTPLTWSCRPQNV